MLSEEITLSLVFSYPFSLYSSPFPSCFPYSFSLYSSPLQLGRHVAENARECLSVVSYVPDTRKETGSPAAGGEERAGVEGERGLAMVEEGVGW